MSTPLGRGLASAAFILAAAATANPAAAASCASLAGLSLPNVTITAAQSVPAGTFTAANGQVFQNLPAFCRVAAFATPTPQSHINFEVWMPASGWNKRFRGEGSGGSAGAIGFSAMVDGLTHNYATMANDNGHIGSSWTFSQPGERVVDFGNRAQHVTTVAGKAITTAFYDSQPQHSYFVGCSQGGHHALMEAQRFPEDYDGIIGGDPANDWNHLMFGELWTGVQSSVKGAAFDLPQAKLDLVTKAALAKCARQDSGLAGDAFLNDPRDCHFNPAVLQCKGADAADCLTAEQLEAVNALYQGPINPRTHRQIFPGFARGSETFWRQVLVGLATPGGSSASFFRDGVFAGQPGFNFLNVNFDSDVALTDAKAAAGGVTWGDALNANNADLTPFKQRGGKLIMYHGFADPFITPFVSLEYYTAVIEKTVAHGEGRDGHGRGHDDLADTRDFARLFMVPGMNHCAGGPGANIINGAGATGGPEDADHDVVMALDRWVTHGVAPDKIIATKFVNDRPANGIAFQRPLCPYPEIARYKGAGDTTNAANFVCIVDHHDDHNPRFTDFIADDDDHGDDRDDHKGRD
jgi:feruloyl esterase